jgi:hypothetical protein
MKRGGERKRRREKGREQGRDKAGEIESNRDIEQER